MTSPSQSDLIAIVCSRLTRVYFDRRQNSDYGEIFTATQAEAAQSIKEAEDFVSVVKVYLQKT